MVYHVLAFSSDLSTEPGEAAGLRRLGNVLWDVGAFPCAVLLVVLHLCGADRSGGGGPCV